MSEAELLLTVSIVPPSRRGLPSHQRVAACVLLKEEAAELDKKQATRSGVLTAPG